MTLRGNSGFTLLEVMLALAIMATVILTLLSSVNYHLGIVSAERDTAALTVIARNRMTELVQQGALQQKGEGTLAPSHPELTWRSELLPTQLPTLQKLVFRLGRTGDKQEVTLVYYLLK